MSLVKDEVSKVEKKMIENFQCPGCVSGSNLKCGAFKLHRGGPRFDNFACQSHCAGTNIGFPGQGIKQVLLGLPKGFTQTGDVEMGAKDRQFIRLWEDAEKLPGNMWDHLNVPVWALVQDGYLFVRTYSPRINLTFVDVIKGGTLALVPKAIDVGTFIDQIDA